MKKLLFVAIALAAAYFGAVETGRLSGRHDSSTSATASGADAALTAAFEKQQSNVQVQGSGHVSRVLPDDNDGSRHQRFLVRLASGQTLLIAHNIDLANRVDSLRAGDSVEFYGEYEWNAKGGVIHWTHRDPGGRHVDGWIKHDGQTYQ